MCYQSCFIPFLWLFIPNCYRFLHKPILQQQTGIVIMYDRQFNKTGPIKPWNLGQVCKLNNKKLDMFVKMVHVDRFMTQDSRELSSTRNKFKSNSEKRDAKSSKNNDIDSYLIPYQIVNNLPIWNHRKTSKTSHARMQDEQDFILFNESHRKRTRKSSHKTRKSCQSQTKSPALNKWGHHQIEQRKFKIADKTQRCLRMTTAPNQYSHSNKKLDLQVNEISLLSQKSRKPKVGELLEFSQQKSVKLRRFKRKINDAKITSMPVVFQ